MCDAELLASFNQLTYGPGSKSPRWENRLIRNLKLDNELNPLQRFTVLPNVHGQRYTIGNTFTTREEQGEFIFLQQKFYPVVGGTVAEIVVENNKYFLSPTSSGCKVFLNKMQVLNKTELAFDDILWFDNEVNAFLFKERELRTETTALSHLKNKRLEEKEQKEEKLEVIPMEFIPGQNELILSKILSFVSVEELRELRFVSRQWNEEAFKILRKRCCFLLDFSWGYENSHESMKLFRYSIDMGTSPLSHWWIKLPAIGMEENNVINVSEGRPGSKLLEDIKYLRNTIIIGSLKTLELTGTINSQMDYDVRLKFLEVLSPRLEEFTWSGEWYLETASGEDYPFPEDIQFPKLTVLTLSMSIIDEGGNDATDCSSLTWLQPLIKAVKRVTTIRLNFSDHRSILSILTQPEIMRTYSNLSKLNLSYANVEVIQLLLKLDKPLKKLTILDFEKMSKQHFYFLEKLLRKHCQTLESLFLIIPRPYYDEEDTPPVVLTFPRFPKLEKLNLGWSPKIMGGGNPLYIQLSFPSDVINYKDFPCLKYLALWPTGFGKYKEIGDYTTSSTEIGFIRGNCGEFYGAFFPPIVKNGEMQIVKSLQFLDVLYKIPVSKNEISCLSLQDENAEINFDKVLEFCDIMSKTKHDTEETPLFSKDEENLIATMFPNVRNNEWLNSV